MSYDQENKSNVTQAQIDGLVALALAARGAAISKKRGYWTPRPDIAKQVIKHVRRAAKLKKRKRAISAKSKRLNWGKHMH